MNYLLNNPERVWLLLGQHVQMVTIALLISIVVAVPLGVLITRYRFLTVPIMGTLGILYTVPSLAMIVLLIPIFGLNATSVIIALIIYAQVILVRNVVAALTAISPAVIEAAYGMGMSTWQCWWQVQVPLALPIVLAGVRLAAVVCIGIAAIGARFNAGGIGVLLFDGIAMGRDQMIWAGAMVLAVVALVVNSLLRFVEWAVDPQTRIKRAARQHAQSAPVTQLSS
ncbi:MAG: ABC transporter permease [Chloroflexaceae bacterium]|nr:ABC transporter permease [Chloroflexaceae bacterium]